MGIPGEKFLGKDKDGWEYTSHDLWRKKMIWKPEYKKIWKIEKKQEWVSMQLLFLYGCVFSVLCEFYWIA